MKNLHDTIYEILGEYGENEIPKLEALDRIMTEIKRDVDKIEKVHIESIDFLTEVSKKLIDHGAEYEKQNRFLTRKLLKV